MLQNEHLLFSKQGMIICCFVTCRFKKI